MIPRVPEQLIDKLDLVAENVLGGRISAEASTRLSAELWNTIFTEFLYNTEMGEKFSKAIAGNIGRKLFASTETEGLPIIFEFLPYPDIIRARVGEVSEVEDLPGILARDAETGIRVATGRIDLVQSVLSKKIKFRNMRELMRIGSAPLTILLSVFTDEDLVREKIVKLLPKFDEIFKRYGV
jgi:hypothetical protein